MSTSELFAAFEADTTNHKNFEALVKHLIAEDDRESLENVYSSMPEWASEGDSSRLFQILSQQARMAKTSDIGVFLNFQNGILLWREWGDARKAEMCFRKMKGPAPDQQLITDFYMQFYAEQKNWRKLEQFLTASDGAAMDNMESKRLLAQLAEEKDDKDKAAVFWQAVYNEDPYDQDAEPALRRLYAEIGKWHAMVDLLKTKLGALGDDEVEARIPLHLEMIDLYKNQLNAATKVVGEWQAILAMQPDNMDALDALADEYTEMKRWPDLVKVLHQKVEHEADAEKVVELHKEIASIMMERFNNAKEAVSSYEAILELQPDNAEAMAFLKNIYEERRDWENYIKISEMEVEMLDDPAERDLQYVELAKLASDKIRKPDVPIRLWERVRAADENHPDALEQLEGLYEREKNFDELTRILDARANLTDATADKVALLEKLGQIYSSKLQDEDEASLVWRRLLELDPEHRKAQAELKKKYTAERDWENLEWFFRNYATVHEWVRTLEQQVKHVEDETDRTTLLFKAAAVWQEELNESRRAMKNLEAVLEIDDRHAQAAAMLIPIYHEAMSWSSLPNVYDIVLSATEDVPERRKLLLDLAVVQEKELSNAEAAFVAYVQAVQENPNDVGLHPELKRLAEASGEWEAYVGVLLETVELIEDPLQRIDVYLEMGTVFQERLSRTEDALQNFNKVIELDDANRPALDALEGIYGDIGEYEDLIAVLNRKLDIAEDAEERQRLLFTTAGVWRENLENNQEAEAIYREMLDDFPTVTAVHDELIIIYLEEERYEPLRDVLERKRDILAGEEDVNPERLADLECELGMLAYGIQPDEEGVHIAVGHFEEALHHSSVHESSILNLEQLLSNEVERLRITRLLEPVYRERNEWQNVADVLEIQLQAAVEEEDELEQVSLLERLAELYRDYLSNLDLAWRTYGRLFEIEAHREDVRSEFERLTKELERAPKLVELYMAHAEDPPDAEARISLKLVVARTWHTQLEDPDKACEFYHKLLDENPEHTESLDALEAIYFELDRSEQLLDVYRRKVELADQVDDKLDYLFRMCDRLRDRLKLPEDAIAAAQEALDLQPGNMRALKALDELFTMTGQWPDLEGVLVEMTRLAEDDTPRVATLTTRLAELKLSRLDDVLGAVELYADVFKMDPDNLPTLEALERLFGDEEHAPVIAPLLQEYYDRTGDWPKLIDVYAVRENAAEDEREKIDWHYKIAELYEVEGANPESAFEHYVAAAQLDPGSEQTLDQLLRISDVLENHAMLIEHLEALVEDIDYDDRRRETHHTIARLARAKTGDVETAERHLRSILELDPGDMQAIDELIGLYREQENHEALVEMLLNKAPMLEHESDEKHSLYAEAGELCARVLGDPERAIEIYETLQQLDPQADRALTALEELYAVVERWDDLNAVYRTRIDRSEELETRKYYAALMGKVQAEKQLSPDDAIMTWRQILEWDPQEIDALYQLDELYSEQEDWYNLLDVLKKMQELVDGPGWEDCQLRIARLYESDEHLGDIHQGIAAYGALLERRPDHPESIAGLKAIIKGHFEREAAFAVLKPILASSLEFEELWEQYEIIQAHQEDDVFRRVETLHEMAGVAEQSIDDPQRAFEAQSRAFRFDMRNAKTVQELERLAEAHMLWEDLVQLYSEGGENADDAFLGLEFWLKTGAILMDRLVDPERAIAVYSAVYEDHPDHGEIQERLHQLYENQELYSELVTVIRSQIESAQEPDTKISFLAKLAQVSELQLSDLDAAYEAYMEVLFVDERSELAIGELRRLYDMGVHRLDIAERLEPIYKEREAWPELHSLLELKLEVLEDALDQLHIMRQLAELNINKLESKPSAIGWYGRAFRLDPEDDGLLHELKTLAEETGLWSEVKGILMDGAEVADDEERKVQLWLMAAAISRDRIGDIDEAERVFRLVLGTDEQNFEALKALDDLLVAAERWDDLEPVLAKEADVADFDDVRIPLLVRLAELYRDRLGRWEDSIKAYREVLDLNDMHRDTLFALRDMYQRDESWELLFEILQQLSDTATADEERARHTSDQAIIAEQYLGRDEDAVALWEDVLMIAPQNYDAVHQLQRLLETQENWQSLVEAYERELRMGVDDPTRRLDLFKRIGRVWMHQLEDGMAAQTYWEQARGEASHDQETLEALHVIYQEGYNFEQLEGVIEAQLQSGLYEVEQQLGLWREQAELRTEQLRNPSTGIDAWRAVMELAPGDSEAIENLEQLFEQEARWSDAVELFRIKLNYLEDEEQRIQTWLWIGSIQHDNLNDPPSAAGTYREILEYQPSNVEASQRLENIYENAQQWTELAGLLTDRDAHLPEIEDRMMNLRRLAGIYEHQLGDQENSFNALSAAIQLVPDDPEVLIELARLAEATGLWEDMLVIYDFVLEHLEDEEKMEVLIRAATAQRDKLTNAAESADYFARALELSPENETALRALIELYQQLEEWEKLVQVLMTLSEVSPDYEERKQLCAGAGAVLEGQLEDKDRAVGAWEAILDIDEMDKEALSSLERLHEEREDWRALIDILNRIAMNEPDREVELRLRSAEILESFLEEVEEAIEEYENVLSVEPGNDKALEALELLYGEREEWDKLIDVYERSYEAAVYDEERIEACRKVAMVQREIFKNPEEAAEAFMRILYIDQADAEAIEALEAIYTTGEQWDDLIELCERKQNVAETPEGKAAALTQMAQIYEQQLFSIDDATTTYERLLGEISGHVPSLDELDRLYESQELWEQVIDVIERKLAVEADRQARLDLLCRQGKLRAAELSDNYGAAQHYEKALTERPGYDPAVDALVELYGAEENWEQVSDVLNRKLSTVEDPVEQAPVHVRLAAVYREKMEQSERALFHLEKAVEGDPESEDTLWPLADYYIEVENWTKSTPLLEVLVDKMERRGEYGPKLAQLHLRLGKCAEAMFDIDMALDEYRAAQELESDNLDVVRGMARLSFKKEQWADAVEAYTNLLRREDLELDEDDITRCYLRLGEASMKMGQTKQAKDYLARVIENQPNNPKALEEIVTVFEAAGDWYSAITYKEQLLNLKSEPLDRFTILLSIGDIQREHMGNPDGAIESYEAALRHGNFSKAPLLQLVQVYAERRNYSEAVHNLNKLIQIEEDPKKQARYAWTAAVMYRDELADSTNAIKYLNLVLDFDINKLEAFQAVDALLTKEKAWKPLEQNYRKMIQRVVKAGAAFEKGPALLFTLYKNLGEVYRSRLRNYDYAISSFELAAKQRPKDSKIRDILAELYERTDNFGSAVDQHRTLIHQNPQNFDSYHALLGLYRKSNEYDPAWCIAGLLCTLGKADEQEEAFYREFSPQAIAEVKRVVDDTVWAQFLMNPEQDRLLGEVFFSIYQSLGKEIGQKTLKDFGLHKKKDKVNLEEPTLFSSVVKTVSQILNVPPPDFYVSPTKLGLEILPTYPPVISVGQDMMAGKGEQELAFHVAKYLSYFQRWHTMAALYSHDELDLMFLAASALVDPERGIPIRQDLPPEQAEAIQQHVGLFLEFLATNSTAQQRTMLGQVLAEHTASGVAPKIGLWHRQVELSANHAGLLVANDIELVGRILRDEVAGISKLGRGDKMKDLVNYVLSDRYLQMRELMGIKLEV